MEQFIIHMQAICGRLYMIVNGQLFEFEYGGLTDEQLAEFLELG